MRSNDQTLLTTAHHCRRFIDNNGVALRPVLDSSTVRGIDDDLTLMAELRGIRAGISVEEQETAERACMLRRELRLIIQGVVRAGQQLVDDLPELAPLAVPPVHASAASLMFAAYAAADIVDRHAECFADAGAEPFTADNLRRNASLYAEVVDERRASREFRRALSFVERVSMKGLRTRLRVLDGQVLSQLSTRPTLAAEWAAVRSGNALVLWPQRAA